MITNLLFDLDNTILDFDQAERNALRHTLLALGIEPSDAILKRYHEINQAQWKLLEQGKITRSQLKVTRYQLLFREFHLDCSPKEAAHLYESRLGIGHYFVDGALELIRELYGSYRLHLCTNGTSKVQKSRIKSAGLEPYFENIFISEDIGFDKPSIQYFQFCFNRIPDFDRKKALIVGDSLSSDIQGGIQAGLKTVWFNPSRMPASLNITPDYEIDRIRDLLAVLKKEAEC